MLRRISILLTLSIFLIAMGVQPAAAATTYKVKSGDSLYKIARTYKTTVPKLQALNKMGKRTALRPGQTLLISTTNLRAAKQAISRGGTASAGVIRYSPQEVDLLARLINAEAGGESYQAQVAVGSVVVNRVQSRIFPNTLTRVIYQVEDGHYQFSPVLNGWINKPASASALKAARQALTGYDATNGALYFFVTGTPNRFLQAKTVSTVIDQITFSF